MGSEKVLVLGATGNLGAYSAVALRDAGCDVVAVGRRESDNGFFEDRGIPYYSLDITEKGSLNFLGELGIECIVNFAGELPSRCSFDPQRLMSSITMATLNVLEFMREFRVGRLVFPTTPYDLSYLHETGKPIDPDAPRSYPATGDHSVYAIAKNAAVDLIEHYHCEYGIDRFILRFFTIYQYHPNAYHFADKKMRKMPYRMLIDRAKKGEDICVFGDSSRVKEMVYIKDFTKVVVGAVSANSSGGFYNIGSPSRVSLKEMIEGIVDVFSPEDAKSEITFDPSKPNTLQSMLDWSKTANDLGYSPEYDYRKMLQDIKAEMLEEPFSKLWGKGEDYELLYGSSGI